MALRSLSCIFFLLPFAVAYRDTVPLVAWSSHHSPKLDSFASRPGQFTGYSQLFDAFVKESELCNFEAIIIADQPGLHASDLRAFRKDSHLHKQLTQTKSSLQIPYLPYSNDDSFEILKSNIVQRCGARRVEVELGQGGIVFHKGEKHIVAVSMPSLEEEHNPFGREKALADCDERLHKDIANVASVFPSHIVIYTSSRPLKKRQAAAQVPETPMDASRPTINNAAAAPPNPTLIKGSLTQRYRFFTPGLITALLIVFGILVPLLMFGIYALASIQSPVRMDTPKGSSLEKKNQ